MSVIELADCAVFAQSSLFSSSVIFPGQEADRKIDFSDIIWPSFTPGTYIRSGISDHLLFGSRSFPVEMNFGFRPLFNSEILGSCYWVKKE